MGDFNAQIGVQLPGEEYVIGKYGKGKKQNGEKLVEFLLENNLTPLNTIFRKKPKNKWTWISPDGNTRNEIDYIITNKARSFKDTNIIQNLNFNTNHRMVRSCLNENVTKNPRPKTVNINYPPVKENTEDLMEAINSNMNINEKYKRIENKLNEYARKQIRKKNEPYLSEKTLELIEDRKI
ncbi:Craniofacial development protein 2 [Eumeta japonica]|uniref:Craniofacial development protein 2 n=1 Tax=Eumeta variegata TaxID=151549 RepID=A0A4C1XJ03_EUMVA|nr:Craniofacial development protein 2 [Eumeta japonica]